MSIPNLSPDRDVFKSTPADRPKLSLPYMGYTPAADVCILEIDPAKGGERTLAKLGTPAPTVEIVCPDGRRLLFLRYERTRCLKRRPGPGLRVFTVADVVWQGAQP